MPPKLGAHTADGVGAVLQIEWEKQEQQSTADFAYTIAAARRSEQRRLLCFIRMSDCMIADTLTTVLLESVAVSVCEPTPGPLLGTYRTLSSCLAACCITTALISQPC